MGEKLPAPKNGFLAAVFTAIDILVLGLGETAAASAAVAACPWLGWPIINSIFKGVLGNVAKALDESLKIRLGKVIIRFQNDGRKDEYDKEVERFKETLKPGASKEDHDKALDDTIDKMDRLINRNK